MEQRTPRVLVSLAGIVAPAGWLSLSLTPSHCENDDDEPAVVMEAAPVPSPANTSQVQLPPKKRKRSSSSSSSGSVHQETAARTMEVPLPPATSSSSSSSSVSRKSAHSLAIIVCCHGNDGIPESNSSPSQSSAAATLTMAAVQPKPVDAAVPTMDPAEEPIDAVPLRAAPQNVVAPQLPPLEPAWIRPSLGLPNNLPLHFITRKLIQTSDLEPQQSRLLLHRDDVNRRLPPLLYADEVRAAGLDEPWARPEPQTSHDDGKDKKKARAKGVKHGGLPVPVFVNSAGVRINTVLTRWSSNGNTVLKFVGEFRTFVSESGVRKDDVIEVWAFRRHGVLHFVMSLFWKNAFSRTGAESTAPAAAPPAATNGGQEETRHL